MKIVKLNTLLMSLVAATFFATPAFAQEDGQSFGSKGTLSISTQMASAQFGENNTGGFRPQAVIFVKDNFAVGGNFGYAKVSSDGGAFSVMVFAPEIGFNVKFSENLSLYSKAQLLFLTAGVDDSRGSGDADSIFGFGGGVEILAHFKNAFVGIGPSIQVLGAEGGSLIATSINTKLGAWF